MSERLDDVGYSTRQSWQKRIDFINQKRGITDPLEQDVKDYYYKENEVGIKHPINNASVKITDEGYVDLFAKPTLGIRIDPITDSINIFAENLNLFGKQLNIRTKPNAFNWNGYYFNPQLYFENDKEKDQHIAGDKLYWEYQEEDGWQWRRRGWRIQPMIKGESRTRYTEGMVDILQQIGLPTE